MDLSQHPIAPENLDLSAPLGADAELLRAMRADCENLRGRVGGLQGQLDAVTAILAEASLESTTPLEFAENTARAELLRRSIAPLADRLKALTEVLEPREQGAKREYQRYCDLVAEAKILRGRGFRDEERHLHDLEDQIRKLTSPQ